MENSNEYSFTEDFKNFVKKKTGKVFLLGGLLASTGVLSFFATYDYEGEVEAVENCELEPMPTQFGVMVSPCKPEQTTGGIVSDYFMMSGLALMVSGVSIEFVRGMKGASNESQ